MSTTRVRDIVLDGIDELRREAVGHREAGRIPMAERLELFCDATSDYIRMLENTIKAAWGTIKALER